MTESVRPDALPPSNDLAEDLLESIEAILGVVKSVGSGDLTQKLDLPYAESHPVGALVSSINAMVEALGAAREKSAHDLNELTERIAMIERQREAIRNLSVPIIEVWTGVLCAPVVGVLDSMRASEVTTALLTAVVVKKAQHVIIDVTGVEVMDTQSTDHFLRIARAVTLLGANCALSGMHPNVARTIVQMGVDLHGLVSYRTMREALKHCVAAVNARARRTGKRQ
jgi:rsbT co-antagonist protein RsbR